MVVQSAKKVAEAAKTKSRYLTEGYKRSEERKKLRKARDSFQKKLASGKIEDTQESRDYLTSINKAIDDSYMIRNGEKRGTYTNTFERFQNARITVQETVRDTQAFKSEIENFDVVERTPAEKRRQSQMFERQINQASVSGGISTVSKYETKMFYAVTQRYWEGYPASKINERLMQVFNTDSIKDVWDIVMNNEEVKAALEQAQKNGEDIESTEDDSFKKDRTDESGRKGSPPMIQQIVATLAQQANPFMINLSRTEMQL